MISQVLQHDQKQSLGYHLLPVCTGNISRGAPIASLLLCWTWASSCRLLAPVPLSQGLRTALVPPRYLLPSKIGLMRNHVEVRRRSTSLQPQHPGCCVLKDKAKDKASEAAPQGKHPNLTHAATSSHQRVYNSTSIPLHTLATIITARDAVWPHGLAGSRRCWAGGATRLPTPAWVPRSFEAALRGCRAFL